MLSVDTTFVNELREADEESFALVASDIIDEQTPPRDWHPDKINRFLLKLKKQTGSNEATL